MPRPHPADRDLLEPFRSAGQLTLTRKGSKVTQLTLTPPQRRATSTQALPLLAAHPQHFDPAVFSYDAWAWAVSVVSSRSWSQPRNAADGSNAAKAERSNATKAVGSNATKTHMMVPAADMPNHRTGAKPANWIAGGGIALVAAEALSVRPAPHDGTLSLSRSLSRSLSLSLSLSLSPLRLLLPPPRAAGRGGARREGVGGASP